jgi:hypothetical protein
MSARYRDTRLSIPKDVEREASEKLESLCHQLQTESLEEHYWAVRDCMMNLPTSIVYKRQKRLQDAEAAAKTLCRAWENSQRGIS